MKKTRIKTPVSEVTREDAETLVGDIARLITRERRLHAEIDKAVIAIKERHKTELTEIAAALKEKQAKVQSWAQAADFGGRKSMELTHGVVGFRTGTPKLKTLSGWTFDRVLEKLLSLLWGREYVRTKKEVDKEGLIAAASSGAISGEELRSVGVRVVQDESFFIEPNLSDETPARVGNPA